METVQAGHVEIEQKDVHERGAAGEELESFFAGGGEMDGVAFGGEDSEKDFAQDDVVVDDEDVAGWGGGLQ